MDPLTLIIAVIMIIFFFPLIIRGVGCLLRLVALAVLIIGAIMLFNLIF